MIGEGSIQQNNNKNTIRIYLIEGSYEGYFRCVNALQRCMNSNVV